MSFFARRIATSRLRSMRDYHRRPLKKIKKKHMILRNMYTIIQRNLTTFLRMAQWQTPIFCLQWTLKCSLRQTVASRRNPFFLLVIRLMPRREAFRTKMRITRLEFSKSHLTMKTYLKVDNYLDGYLPCSRCDLS